MNDKALKVFLVRTVLVTWVSWWLLAYLTRIGALELHNLMGWVLLIIGGSAPTFVAYIAAYVSDSEKGIAKLNASVFKKDLPTAYYAYAFVVPAVFGGLGLLIASIRTPGYLVENPVDTSWIIFILFIVSIFMGGIEEVGWRGIFQREIEKKWPLWLTAVVIGVVWSLWHLPFFYIEGMNHYGTSFPVFVLSGIGYSAFLTWLYHRTKSVFICILFHASINTVSSMGLGIPLQRGTDYLILSVVLACTGMLLVTLPPKIRKRVGR